MYQSEEMKTNKGIMLDTQESLKKKTTVPRSWILIDRNGESKILEMDKYDIMQRVRIYARDLRILEPVLSYPSAILCRERAIILNLEVVKILIFILVHSFFLYLIEYEKHTT